MLDEHLALLIIGGILILSVLIYNAYIHLWVRLRVNTSQYLTV
jgi:hypothetical protein